MYIIFLITDIKVEFLGLLCDVTDELKEIVPRPLLQLGTLYRVLYIFKNYQNNIHVKKISE